MTKRLSLLECVNIVDDVTDWKTTESIKSDGNQWLAKNHIKAFYSVSRHSSFVDGARISMELSGIGKMRPNLLLVGFKDNWQATPGESRDYYKTLQLAFEMKLSVAILRIGGGLDLSSEELVNDLIKSDFIKASSNLSVDSGLDELRDLPTPSPSSLTPPASIAGKPEPQSGLNGMRKAVLGRIGKNKVSSADAVLTSSSGREIQNAEVVSKMTQFRNTDPVEGNLDVYWLYDDGGLTLLMAYILSTRKKYSKSKLRIFTLCNSDQCPEEEKANMTALLKMFRIKFDEIVIITDATKLPGQAIRQELDEAIQSWIIPDGVVRENESADKPASMTSADVAGNADKTNFYLRMAEVLRSYSGHSSMVLMTLPMPRKDDSLPHGLYLAWLDILTKNMPPFLLIRGNQESVLTFYS